MTPEDLLAFEEDIAKEFAAGKIKAPIHLGGGNEQRLINIFRDIRPEDWVLCGWRSHYHCLLKGVPPNVLKRQILKGHSVALTFPEHKVLCSGIMGGIAPIAAGLAWAIAQRGRKETGAYHLSFDSFVYCFLGDMSAESGIAHEAMKYAARWDLPVTWIIEDNGLSVCTPTQASWGEAHGRPDVERYHYKLSRPHSGIGQWVRFGSHG
jgi:TPP-dependent pyruvate/acetoin dehydrogenase alpha subunit